jgi:hypothetical protein
LARNIRIIQIQEFLIVTAEGRFDLEKTQRALLEVAAVPGSFTDYDILLDTRDAAVDLSAADFWYLARELADLKHKPDLKIGIVCPPERFDRAEFFSLCSTNRGVKVNAFTSFEAAVNWMGGPAQSD